MKKYTLKLTKDQIILILSALTEYAEICDNDASGGNSIDKELVTLALELEEVGNVIYDQISTAHK